VMSHRGLSHDVFHGDSRHTQRDPVVFRSPRFTVTCQLGHFGTLKTGTQFEHRIMILCRKGTLFLVQIKGHDLIENTVEVSIPIGLEVTIT
jgi:hypothetical protein